MAFQSDLVLSFARDLPFLGGDLGMLAHAHPGGTVAHGWNVKPDVVEFQVERVAQLLTEGSCVLKLPNPVRKRRAEPQLNPAQTIDAADKGEVARGAIDHTGGLEHPHHAGRASHDRGKRRNRRIDSGIHQNLAGDVAPRQIGDDVSPDGKIGLAAVEQPNHVLDHRDRHRNGVKLCERTIDFGKWRANAGG